MPPFHRWSRGAGPRRRGTTDLTWKGTAPARTTAGPEFAARRQTPVKWSYFQGFIRDAVAACAYGVAGGRVAKVVEIGGRRHLRVTGNHPIGGWNRQGDHAMSEISDTDASVPSAVDVDDDPIEDRLRRNIRATIEASFEEELEAFLGRCRYGRGAGRAVGYRRGRPRARRGPRGTLRPRPRSSAAASDAPQNAASRATDRT